MRSAPSSALLAILLLSIPILTQQLRGGDEPFIAGASKPEKDKQAVAVIQAAIAALGGSERIAQINDWSAQAQIQRFTLNAEQGGTIVWERSGTEFRTQTATPDGTNLTVSAHGRPVISTPDGKVRPLPRHVVRAQFNPATPALVLLAELQDPNCSIDYGGMTKLGDQSVAVIRTAVQTSQMEARVTPQTWYFDSASGVPLRVEYRLPGMSDPRLSVDGVAEFSNFQNVGGVVYPFQIVRYRMGKHADTITLKSVNLNPSIAPTDFDAPNGGLR